MTKRLGLGVVVGSVNSVAAIDPDGSGAADGSGYVTVARTTALRLSPDAPPVLGADPRSLQAGRHSKDVLLDGFAARVGDPVGILADDGSTYTGEDLMATAIGCLVHDASIDLHSSPTIVATYPTAWPHYTVEALRNALDRAGFADVTPVPEATAAVRWLESARGPLGDGAVVVYDLGGCTLDVTVMRTGAQACIIGKPIRSEDIAGSEFDHLTMQYVLANADTGTEFDPFDPATERALAQLRARSARAKETLSSDTETALAVELPGVHREVRLVRGELEDLLRAPLLTSIELVREAVRMAGLDLTDISQVLLTGGGAAIPLVAELISTELGLPVVAAARPEQTAALGAAMLATDLGASTAEINEPVPAALPAVRSAGAVALPASAAVARPPIATALPTETATPTGMARWKKIAIVAGSAAAITLLAAGGLSIGTGGLGTSPTNDTGSTSAPATPTNAVPAAGNSTAPGQPANNDGSQPGTTAAGTTGGVNPGAPNNQPGAPTSAAGAPAPAPAAGQPPAPAPQAPAPQAPQPQAPAPSPAPGSDTTTTPGTGGGNYLPTLPEIKSPIGANVGPNGVGVQTPLGGVNLGGQ